MEYKATIIIPSGNISNYFTKMTDAEMWIDSHNNNMEYPSMIETYEAGRKTDGFFYTEVPK